jgi:hypothetical protein
MSILFDSVISPSQEIPKVVSYSGGRHRRIAAGHWPGKSVRPYQKQTKAQRAGQGAEVVEHLPGKQEALSGSLVPPKTKPKNIPEEYQKKTYSTCRKRKLTAKGRVTC